MDIERNIALAKKYVVESVYRAAKIEGIGITLPETQVICEGMSVAGKTIDEINAVRDLRNAWQWIFNNPSAQADIESLMQLNRIAGKFTVINSGRFRDGYDEPIRVSLGDSEYYYPPLPETNKVSECINTILSASTDTLDIALELFCFVAKSQLFNDGNKRTANLFANLYMIQNGNGILSVPEEKNLEFYNYLVKFYRDDSEKPALKAFLLEYCVTGNGKC